MERNEVARVIGAGAVYLLDWRGMTYTNSAGEESGTMSAFGIKVHLLSVGDSFALSKREPSAATQKEDDHAYNVFR